ncbi:hypothetical protein [Helicobacter pullorum]|uniref:hypothetical protein n=1 Tax=Helicobacter pullorum TaxID=35818 RepID=UPI0006CCAA99|nr:hypothetical protein [Helicobacter pullorum]KPH53916.1 hypothetical protein HPU229254_09680 [Helicobacter pullorum]OCR17059.1 hypothetical protein BA915_01580 [Helicobacter pullorum]
MKISDFDGAKKIADIVKDNKNTDNLKLDYVADAEVKKGEKCTYAKVVNEEVTNIFESSNFRQLDRYFKNHNTIKRQGDKASDSNFAKYPLAKANIEKGDKVEIYELQGTKKECLEKYHKQENRYPDENFQANNEKIPDGIIKEYEQIRRNGNENKRS